MSSDASRKARHEFQESPPGKAGFRISSDLLGGRSPMFDQLDQRLAAATQPLAFLEFVEQGHKLAWQLKQHFLAAGSTKPLTVQPVVEGRRSCFLHRRTRISSLGSRLLN